MAGDQSLYGKALLSGYAVGGSFQQYAIGKAAHAATSRIPKGVPLDGMAPIPCSGITVCTPYFNPCSPCQTDSSGLIKPLKNLMPVQVKL